MIDCAPEHLERLLAILDAHVPERTVLAFGSRVVGGARPWSDLDLVLVGPDRLDLVRLGRLREALEASDIPFRVDVTDWHRASEAFRRIVAAHQVILREGTPRADASSA